MRSGRWSMKRGLFGLVIAMGVLAMTEPAWATREVHYNGGEQNVWVNPGEPTQVVFPCKITGGFKKKDPAIALQREGDYLVIFATPELSDDGEAILVICEDKRSYSLRVLPANDDHARDEQIKLVDERDDTENTPPSGPDFTPNGRFPPATIAPGLVREMILVAEFGKKRAIPGYRRSNRYTGETVLHDGAMNAKIDEIFMGSDLWGYVLTVENLLDTTQRINPATFRLDGTRAVAAERWELAPRPQTAEQKVSDQHKAHVYIVTKALKN